MFTAESAVGADRYAAALAGQTMLGFVRLAASDLTDAGLTHFKTLPSLVSLDIRGTKVTQTGVEALRAALPDCKVQWVPPAQSTSPTADRDRAAAEWVLGAGGRVGYILPSGGGAHVTSVAELPAEPFYVAHVNFWGVKALANADLDHLTGLDRLGELMLDETDVDREAIPRIAKLQFLRSLMLSGTRIQSSDLAGLAAIPKLTFLGMKAGRQNDDSWCASISTFERHDWPSMHAFISTFGAQS